jgi:hypothetical protein
LIRVSRQSAKRLAGVRSEAIGTWLPPDVCDGTSAVGESRHRIQRRIRWDHQSSPTWSCEMPNPHPAAAGNVPWRLALRPSSKLFKNTKILAEGYASAGASSIGATQGVGLARCDIGLRAIPSGAKPSRCPLPARVQLRGCSCLRRGRPGSFGL